MLESLTQFYDTSKKYIELFNTFAHEQALVGRAQADHICYKCASTASFEVARALFETTDAYLFQSIISGRRIAYIRLGEGIKTVLGTIVYLELSDQKPDGSQKEGFDHIEVFATAMSYAEMVEELTKTQKVVHVKRPHHTTDDVVIADGFLFRSTNGPLIEKIKYEEMN